MSEILVPISAGELIDKLTILQIKAERIHDEEKLKNVRREHALLSKIAEEQLEQSDGLKALWQKLYAINCDLWDIEDDIRAFEARSDFATGFVALARSVYLTNDERAKLKRAINLLVGSTLMEEKSYHSIGPGQ